MFAAARAGLQLFKTCTASLSFAARSYATEVRSTDINEALSRTSALFKTYKPTSPGRRHLRRPINDHLWRGRPIKALTIPLRKTGGRNNTGRITVRGIGGGHKRRLRTVDFMRTDGGPQDVIRIEYDPGRSAHIALIRARNSEANNGLRYSYILAPEGLRAGDVVQSFRNGIPPGTVPGYDGDLTEDIFQKQQQEEEVKVEEENVEGREQGAIVSRSSSLSLIVGLLRAATVRNGNVLPIKLIPPGTQVHCISLRADKPGILVRSAGTFGTVLTHETNGKYTHVSLQSGEVRKVPQTCCATIGRVSNPLWRGRSIGKAGRNRWLGRRPHVRGMAMNR